MGNGVYMRKGIAFIFIPLLFFSMVGCSSLKAEKIPEEDQEMSMDEIWKIEDANDFIVALTDHVMQKCEYGDDMDSLSASERIFYITQICEKEVNNGGFAQFFDNFSGNFAGEVVGAFGEIGAPKTAEICDRALNAFGRELPLDWEERRELLDRLVNDEIDQILSECDDAFYRYEEDLNALNYAYVMENKRDFS